MFTEEQVNKMIESAIAKERIAYEEETKGLIAKNKEVINKLAKRGDIIDPAEHAKLEETVAKLESDLAASVKANKTALGDLDKVRKMHESESEFTKRLLVDNGLVDALTKAGVTNPVNLKAAKAMLKDQVALVVDGESRKAMLGDKDLNEAITAWAAGDEGKHFIAAPANSGGGAQGSGKPATADIMKLSAKERMEAGRKQS